MKLYQTAAAFALAAGTAFADATQAAQPQQAAQLAQGGAEAPSNQFAHLLPPIEDVTGKIGAGFWEANWHYALIAAIVVLAAAAVLFFILRKKAPPPTPYEIATKRLAHAEKVSDAKEYAQEVSQSVRDYIEATHKLPAPERTTEEFLELASKADAFDGGQKARLEKILKLADMAKFARHSFRENERAEILKESLDFVENDHQKPKDNTVEK